ncbi:hypothetical protein [Peribacillus muralis]
MVELWKHVEATESHNTGEHFTAIIQKAQAFMAAAMNLKVLSGEPVKA